MLKYYFASFHMVIIEVVAGVVLFNRDPVCWTFWQCSGGLFGKFLVESTFSLELTKVVNMH